MSISKSDIYKFLSVHRLAVASTVAESGAPMSALVYAVPTPELELIFYTLQTSRKCENLLRDGRISFVVGWPQENERISNQDTVQYEGIAEEQEGSARDSAKDIYLASLPENAGMAAWPGLTFFRVRPVWIRFSSYGKPWRVEEMRFDAPKPGRHH
jgi:pyridoxine/pyridoxamine 5'-phosphate oxidase